MIDGNKGNVTTVTGSIVNNSGSVTLNNGAILQNNSVSSTGSGIYNVGLVVINGGIIQNNIALHGGGIRNQVGGTLILNAGALISGNIATGVGGGISTYLGQVMLNGAVITNNDSATNGGGVSNNSSEVILNAGAIISNNSANNGGGIYNSGTGILEINNGTVFDNVAASLGNGIYFDAGSVNLGGTTQIGTSLGSGNGIYLNTGMIIGLQSGFVGFANIEGTNDTYFDRPVVEGTLGYTAQVSDLARFQWLPIDFALTFDTNTNQIILGEVCIYDPSIAADHILCFAPPSPPPHPEPNPEPTSSPQKSGPPACAAAKPSDPAPYIYKATGAGSGSITLHFNTGGEPFNKYLLEYGYLNSDFTFGVTIDNPRSGSFTVNDLTPGTTYQFRLIPMNDCAGGPRSNIFPVGVGLPRVPGVPNTGFQPKQ